MIDKNLYTYCVYHLFAVRSKKHDTTALGVALAAGQAIGIDLCSLKAGDWDS